MSNIEDLKIGSIIKNDIKDDKGYIAIKAGEKVTPLMIKRLVAWGVKSIEIVDPNAGQETQKSSQQQGSRELAPQTEPISFDKEHIKQIMQRFSNVRGDPLMEGIMRLAIKHTAGKFKDS